MVVLNKNISLKEGVELFEKSDIFHLGRMAKEIKLRKHGNEVYFVNNKHINYTNICITGCTFCAYSKRFDEDGAYTLQIEEIIHNLERDSKRLKEVHIVGGLHPSLPFSYYIDLVRKIKEKLPHIHIKGFTATEIDHFSKISGLSVEEVLIKLKEVGLGAMPGGGAEIFSQRLRKRYYPRKIDGERYLKIHETAHRLGIPSNCTMLFGIGETPEELISHLIKLRDLQEKTGGFLSFIPLPFHPENTPFEGKVEKAGSYRILKIIAISRIILENIPHIKPYWVMLTPELSQIALHFGGDDLDGTIGYERITHSAGAKSPYFLTEEKLIQLIKSAGFIPVERDGLYRRVKVYE